MRAIDVLDFFRSKAYWINTEDTVDKIIAGNPEAEVCNILVTWMSDFHAINAAIERGFDMIMTHEPTFWIHSDEVRTMEGWEPDYVKTGAGMLKRKLIEENGLVILRNHDTWDRFPEIGITWSWADFLGLGKVPAAIGGNGYQHRYDIEQVSLKMLAGSIAAKTAGIGERFVQVFGREDAIVSKVGIGTGCGCSIDVFAGMGCDVSIVCDDECSYWRDISWAIDVDHPVIRVNHATSEEPGMMNLARYINENLTGVKAEYFPHRCGIETLGPHE